MQQIKSEFFNKLLEYNKKEQETRVGTAYEQAIWNEAVKTVLKNISDTFAKNSLKANSLTETVLLESIAVTINDFPIPEFTLDNVERGY